MSLDLPYAPARLELATLTAATCATATLLAAGAYLAVAGVTGAVLALVVLLGSAAVFLVATAVLAVWCLVSRQALTPGGWALVGLPLVGAAAAWLGA
jgi:hypothetical protein